MSCAISTFVVKQKCYFTSKHYESLKKYITHILESNSTFTDTLLIQTPHYYGQLAMSLGMESPYISLNSTSLMWTIFMASQCPY